MVIQTYWQCLNEEGNQFYTDLATKYLPIFKNSNTDNSEDNLFSFMKEAAAFENTDLGIEADITKEVIHEILDFCKLSLAHCDISYETIYKHYSHAYDGVHNINL